jgi:hypothetical protein
MTEAIAYVPGFEHDIFISYAHVDNLSHGGATGWVDQFHEALDRKIATRVGRLGRVRIWRDQALDGSQVFDAALARRVERSAVFLALISVGYFESDYCRMELQSFGRHARQSPYGLQIGERRRMLNVRLTNLHHSRWPEELQGTTGFPFHDAKEEADAQRHDEARIGEPLMPGTDSYNTRLRELADATYRLLDEFRTAQRVAAEPSAPRRHIYLADTADTLRELRDRLAADLTQKGRDVVTDIPPPYESAAHAAKAQASVEQAGLCVHLLDGLVGRSIQGEPDATYPRRQVELALGAATPQLVWVPPSLDVAAVSSKTHREFLESLEQGTRADKRYDFVREPETRLVEVILDKLERLESSAMKPVSGEPSSLLLDTHPKDQKMAWELGAYLVGRGLQPFIHPETNDPQTGIEAFEHQLAQVNTLVVFFGLVSRQWVEQRVKCALRLVARQLANDIQPTLEACYVYILPPEKEPFDLGRSLFRIQMLDNSRSDRFEPEVAAPLLDAHAEGRIP